MKLLLFHVAKNVLDCSELIALYLDHPFIHDADLLNLELAGVIYERGGCINYLENIILL
jgi:hypothetical protein